jgi:hypothetical protein
VKFSELEPEWFGIHGGPANAGVEFRCPCRPDCSERIPVTFTVALDGSPVVIHGQQWVRSGETFETLTLSPSVDCSHWPGRHWHGFVRNGEIVNA